MNSRSTLSGRPLLHMPDEWAGVEVFVQPFAHSTGFWPCHSISVSGTFLAFDQDTQIAVLWHEWAHCKYWHREKRLLWLPFLWTQAFRRFCMLQELVADRMVVDKGHGKAFLRFLKNMRAHQAHMVTQEHDLHPDLDERITALEAYIKEGR